MSDTIRRIFNEHFAFMGTTLPTDYRQQEGRGTVFGKRTAATIDYINGLEDGVRFLEYYATTKMSGNYRRRIYVDSRVVDLPSEREGIIYDDGAFGDFERAQREHWDYNRQIHNELVALGLRDENPEESERPAPNGSAHGGETGAYNTWLRSDLRDSFQQLFSEAPRWSWPFAPSIPFVGEQLVPGASMLVYASAENLTWMNDQDVPSRFHSDEVWDRYRAVYESDGRGSSTFFPDVGIAPVSNGGLLAAALFLEEKDGSDTADDPRTFLEWIALSNWAKFTIKSGDNQDYIGDAKKLTESLPFIVAELAILRPRLVVLPSGIWRHRTVVAAMRGAAPYTRFLPVWQFNSTVVNCHLGKYDDDAQALRCRVAASPLAEWMSNLKGFNESNAWRYIAFLDSL